MMLMECVILTFQFAHNYGAVLQAYALKKHCECSGYKVRVAGFIPEKQKKEYALSPFARDHRVKAVIKRILNLPYRFKQIRCFDDFRLDFLDVREEYTNMNILLNELENADAIICGSDQIWNEDITGNTEAYYAPIFESGIVKVSYAASFGKGKLSPYQKECVKKYVKNFEGISLREETAVKQVSDLTGRRDVQSVLDPVFLIQEETWTALAEKSRIRMNHDYIVFYALRPDESLYERTDALSKTFHLPVYVIHPTGISYYHNGKRMTGIGPLEFLWLIKHATYVCSNSFHATAFSIIFKKNLVASVAGDKSSRIDSLIKKTINEENCMTALNDILEPQMVKRDWLEEEITRSKEFLRRYLPQSSDR